MLLSLKNLQKNYPGFSLDVSMEVEEGQITGLIGANGAGKSTTFKVILGLVHPDAGEIRLFNKDMEQISQKEKADIGATLSDSGFSNCLTVKQIVHILTETYEKFDREMFEKRCSQFSIPMDKKLKEFSTGMKAKLKVLTATSFDARLLVLDEPTAGLDVIARDSILELLREYMETEGRSILISSHISSDLESLCDDIYMIDKGRIVLHENTDVLLDEYGLIKADEKQYELLDKQHILKVKKEQYGYSCLTDERAFYAENYPQLAIERGSVDKVITMMIKGGSIMKGMFVKDMEIMRGNMKTFIGVYIIAIFCFLSTSAGPSFLISYVSVLAAIMALNTIASDDMDNGMPYIFTFPISRKEYVKEKYLLGAGMVTVLWAVAVAIAIGVNASGYRMVSWEELIASAAAGLFLAVFANAVVFPVQLKYGSSTGRLVLLVLVFGIMAVGWIGVELCQKMKVDFSGLKNLGLRIWNLGIPVCLAMLFVLMLLMVLISCTISIKIMEKKEY